MNYQSGGAFRRSLEQRLSTKTLNSGTPLVRLRKMVAFDRFLARLILAQPGSWVLKGGLALQLRFGNRARTTKDIDLLALVQPENVVNRLREAVLLDLKDWFSFEITEPVRQFFQPRMSRVIPLCLCWTVDLSNHSTSILVLGILLLNRWSIY